MLFQWYFFNCHVILFLWNKCFERSLYFMFSPHNSAVLILYNAKFQNKAITYYTYTYWKTFAVDFFMIKFFTLFIFWLFHTFLNKWVFLKNSKCLWKHVFTEYCKTFINSLFIKGELLYKVRTKLHSKIT